MDRRRSFRTLRRASWLRGLRRARGSAEGAAVSRRGVLAGVGGAGIAARLLEASPPGEALLDAPRTWEAAVLLLLLLFAAFGGVLWARSRRRIAALERAEAALKESEQRLRVLMESANDAIFIADAESGALLDANRRAQELIGRTLEEIREMNQWALHPPEERERYQEIFRQHAASGRALADHLEVIHKDGRRIPVEVSSSIIQAGGRRINQGFFRDVSRRRAAEAALRESEERFRTLAETTSAAILIYQDEGFEYANPAALAMTGHTWEEVKDLKFWELVHPDYRDLVRERGLARQRGEKIPNRYEFKILTKNGEERWVDFSAGFVLWKGRPAGVVTAFDVTERKRAAQELGDRAKQLEALLSSAEAMSGFLDLKPAARAICEAAVKAFGLRMAWIGLVVPEGTELRVVASAGHDEGYTDNVHVRWDLSPRAMGPLGQAIKARRPVVMGVEDPQFAPWREAAVARGYKSVCGLPLLHEDTVRGGLALYGAEAGTFTPERLPVLEIFARQATMAVVNAALYEEAKQTIEELAALNEELTSAQEQQRLQLQALEESQRSLENSETRFRQLAETAEAAIFIARGYRYLYVNPYMERATGYSREELLAMDSWQIVHPEDQEKVRDPDFAQRDPARGALRYELRIIRKDGALRWVDISAGFLTFEGQRAVFGTAYDVTERKRAEEELRASQERFQQIVEHSTNLFYTHTPNHVLTYVSPRSRHYLGCGPEEARVRWMEFLADNPENERGITLTQRAIDSGERQQPYELELKTKDGRQVWVQVNETPIVEGGRTVAIVGALTDITARKQAEQVLQESERRYRAIVEKAGTVVLKFDRDLRVTYWNDFAAEVFGYTREEILGKSLLGSIVPEREASGRDLKALLFAIAEDPDRFASNINQNLTKDGRRLWMAWTNRPILDARGNLQEVLSLAMDITALKESEIAHREMVEGLRRLRSLSPMPLVAVDREARVLEWNGAAAKLTGQTTEEVLGKPCPLLASRGLEEFPAFLAKAEREGEAVQIIRNCRLKDGRRLDLKAVAVPLRDTQGRAASLQIILLEEPES